MPTQESSLRVGVDSRDAERGAKKAERALEKLGGSAKKTEAQFGKLQDSLDGFSSVMAALGIGLAVREFKRLLDITTTINNRLRLVTNTTAELNAVYDELLSISNETRTGLKANAELFNRMAIATSALGLTYREQLGLTRALNQALVISGASAQEAEGALVQLAQGLGAGALQGDELRAVLEGLPKVADVIAQGMGVARGALKTLGSEGQITAEKVVKAFQDAGPQLQAEFAQITPTIESAFNVLNNRLLDFVRNANEATAIGGILARGILAMADNFNTVAAAAAGLAVVITARLIKAFALMTIALATNPLGAIAVAAGALITALGYLSDKTIEFGDATATGWQVAKAAVLTTYDSFVSVFAGIRDFFAKYLGWIGDFVSMTGSKLGDWLEYWAVTGAALLGNIKKVVNGLIGVFVAAFRSVDDVWSALPDLFELAVKGAGNLVAEGVERIVNTFTTGLSKVGAAVDFFADTDLEGKLKDMLTLDLGRLNTDEAAAAVAAAGAQISQEFNESLKLDYVGIAGDALVSSLAGDLDTFRQHLERIVSADKDAADAQDILNRLFKTATVVTNENAEAVKKLRKEKESYVDTLQSEYDRVREATGQAEEVVTAWYNENSATLKRLGLEHTKYAGMLETLFTERLSKARVQDVENTKEWAKGLTEAQRDVAGSIVQEFAIIDAATGGAVAQTQAWYDHQVRILEAAGLAYGQFADRLEVIFGQRMKTAREMDLEAATDWKSGVERSLNDLSGGYADNADMMEGIFTSAFTNMEDAILQFAQTGKMSFKDFARSVAADIMQITLRMLILKALKASMGMAEGGEVTPTVNAASGGHIKGPGSGTSDSIPAMLSDGEFVVRAKYAQPNLDLLKTINAGKFEAPEVPTMRDAFQEQRKRGAETFKDEGPEGVLNLIKAAKGGLVTLAGESGKASPIAASFAQATAPEKGIVNDAPAGPMTRAGFDVAQPASSDVSAASSGFDSAVGAALGKGNAHASQTHALTGSREGASSPAAAVFAKIDPALLVERVEAASGGKIKGPGSGTADAIPAMLSAGEFVVQAKEADKHAALLEMINAGKLEEPSHFAKGGPVVASDTSPTVPLSRTNTAETSSESRRKKDGGEAPQVDVAPPQIRVINVTDPKEALAALDTASGEQVIMNVIERNPDTVRRLLGAS